MTPTFRATAAGRSAGERWRLFLQLLLYNLVLAALLPVLSAWLLWRTLVRRKAAGSWLHRFGFVPRLPARAPLRIWLHAVSAGEMAAARPVLEALRRGLPQAAIAVSTVTTAGMTVARNAGPGADALFYLPFDLPASVALALHRVRPHLVVVLEKELWPNFLGLARLAGARLLMVNGRVSDRMMRRGRLLPGLTRWLHRLPDCLCVQSVQDASRLARLGVPAARILVGGNTKVDNIAERDLKTEARLASDLAVSEGEVWLVAGSTHRGEEEAVLEAFDLVSSEIPRARLLLAPRHLERVAAVSALVAENGRTAARRSDGAPGDPSAVVVLDTMGELRAAYAFSSAAFVGGTLVPVGGHNLLEPVAAGRAVLFGPHTESCADVADLVLQSGVGFQVGTGAELAERFLQIVHDGELQRRVARAAAQLIELQRGAAARCAGIARALLSGERPA
jgi:3-deoxy-D-manno-octulosonic-acid transferase